MTRQGRAWARAGLTGLTGLLPLLLAWIIWQAGGALAVDIGAPTDTILVEHFHAREANEQITYRWSTHAAVLRLPGQALPGILHLHSAVAGDGTQVTLRSSGASGTMQVGLPPHRGPPELRHYRLLWPDTSNAGGWFDLHIDGRRPLAWETPLATSARGTLAALRTRVQQATQESAQREERRLGLIVESAAIQSTPRGVRTVPPLLLCFGLLPLLLAGALGLAGTGARLTAAIALVAGLGLVLLWGWQPLWVQPFLLPTCLGMLALTGLLWWLRRAVPPDTVPDARRLLLVLVVCGGVLPLYLLLKYGIDLWLHPANLPLVALAAALPIPFIPQQTSQGRTVCAVLAGIILVALVGYGFDRYTGAIGKDYATDFTALFRGTRSFVQGGALYNLEHIRANHLGDTYKYPPFFALLMAPITGMDYRSAIFTWHLFNLGLLVAAAGLLLRASRQPLRSWSSLALGYMLLTFKPLVDTLGSGQADILMLVGLAAALLALERGRWALWGAALALPAAIKLYPAYLAAHALVLGRWRGVAGFSIALLLLVGLGVGLLGWPVHATFLFDVLPSIGGGTAWVENQTFNGLLNRFTVEQIGLVPGTSPLVRLLTYGGALLLSALTWWRAQRLTPAAGFGLWIVTLLLVLPIAWMHYQAVLLIPLYLLFVRLEQRASTPDQAGPRLAWPTLLLVGLAWLLLCTGNQWTFFDRTMYLGPLWLLLLSYKFVGLLLLWCALAWDRTGYRFQVIGNG